MMFSFSYEVALLGAIKKEAIICFCESLIFGPKSQKLYGDRG